MAFVITQGSLMVLMRDMATSLAGSVTHHIRFCLLWWFPDLSSVGADSASLCQGNFTKLYCDKVNAVVLKYFMAVRQNFTIWINQLISTEKDF